MTTTALMFDRQTSTTTYSPPNLVDTASQTKSSAFSLLPRFAFRQEEIQIPIAPANILLRIGEGRQMILDVQTGEAGEVIVSHSRLHAYGAGQDLSEATEEFVSMLVDLYEELDASAGILSRHLRGQLNLLRAVFS